jgi:hypothetical protein
MVICHSEEATRGSYISEKILLPDMLVEIRATEESPEASWQG